MRISLGSAAKRVGARTKIRRFSPMPLVAARHRLRSNRWYPVKTPATPSDVHLFRPFRASVLCLPSTQGDAIACDTRELLALGYYLLPRWGIFIRYDRLTTGAEKPMASDSMLFLTSRSNRWYPVPINRRLAPYRSPARLYALDYFAIPDSSVARFTRSTPMM